jgi:hypothetical protein
MHGGLLAAQRKSGLGVRAFCAEEHVTEHSFYAWRREIGVPDGEKTRPAVGVRSMNVRGTDTKKPALLTEAIEINGRATHVQAHREIDR